jgi:hypothetical protein
MLECWVTCEPDRDETEAKPRRNRDETESQRSVGVEEASKEYGGWEGVKRVWGLERFWWHAEAEKRGDHGYGVDGHRLCRLLHGTRQSGMIEVKSQYRG